ncbi:MAG: hypothetical protein JJ895_15770 [Balneolaceae bacterium]|nr:hypothetical protein [Balneolaceae bacterium]
MRKAVLFLAIGLVSWSCAAVYHSREGNKECEVLLPSIAEDYEGYCKNGLAHGEGVAVGLHTYEGDFVAGYPHGEGVYTWHSERKYTGNWRQGQQYSFGTLEYVENGAQETLSGFWYEGELEVISDDHRPHRIINQRGVVSTSIRRQGSDYTGKIFLRFRRNGENVQNVITELNISHSSGTMPNQPGSNSTLEYTIENPSYPLELFVSYKIPNLMNTSLIDNRVQLIIKEPGQYVVDFNNS